MEIPQQPLKISVVTVVLNSIDLVESTINSVIEQTYTNIEYVIIDGGSVDGTLQVIEQYKNRVKTILSEKDNGIYDAMNKAMKIVTGDFILFMNSGDNFYSETTVKEVVEKITDFNSIYFGNAYSYDSHGSLVKYRGNKISKINLARTNICHQTIFYPKNIYSNYYYDLKYRLNADWAYNMSLFKRFKFVFLDLDIAIYNLDGQSNMSVDRNFKRDQVKLIVRYLGFIVLVELIIKRIYRLSGLGSLKKYFVQIILL
jgi:glycosyltransferase involved in cell wall biosynthesis